jgi:plasmid stabilization system protein ParE
LKSLSDIHQHIALDSEQAANQIVDTILRHGDQPVTFPKLGREIDRYNRPGIRELIENPYRIIYRIGRTSIQVIDVFHAAQLPPWER